MSGSEQGAQDTAGHAGHAFGSGHCTTGHRGLGQGGQSPILQGFEHVAMHGGQLGMDVFNTYFDISGTDGHSVFNIYRDMSGTGGHGGTDVFKTYFVGSGWGQGEHSLSTHFLQGGGIGTGTSTILGISIYFVSGTSTILGISTYFVCCWLSAFLLHPHGLGFLQTLQPGISSNFSMLTFAFPSKNPRKRTIIKPTIIYVLSAFI
jgi:hypothetical protein